MTIDKISVFIFNLFVKNNSIDDSTFWRVPVRVDDLQQEAYRRQSDPDAQN